MTDRIKRFRRQFVDAADAALLFGAENRRYFTGTDTADAGVLLVTRHSAYWIIDARYIEAAQEKAPEGVTVILQQELLKQLSDLLKDESVEQICVEIGLLSFARVMELEEKLVPARLLHDVDADRICRSMRQIKEPGELEKIKCAQKITDAAFEYMLGRIDVGRTERELALELEFFVRSQGAEKMAFDTILIGGANTSKPHGIPGEYRLQKGDLVTMDFGADIDGYKSDMTRTVALGSVNDAQKRVYETVLAAQNAALEDIALGRFCRDIDKTARDFINAAGYQGCFGHALGHSVGLEIHETPNFSPSCDAVLQWGMVMTVEPGIYLAGQFGVRIEDLVVVCENGCMNLTNSEKKLIIL